MIILTQMRYGNQHVTEHNTIKDAAIQAVRDIEFNMAAPARIQTDDNKIIWERTGFDSMAQLQKIIDEE